MQTYRDRRSNRALKSYINKYRDYFREQENKRRAILKALLDKEHEHE